ncbi:MAG: carbohydrate kinase family protein, partial [Desulfomonilaceae bacterium]
KDRALVILPNANNLAGSEGIDVEFVSEFQWLHMTSFVSELPLMSQISLLRQLEGKVKVSFDPGPLYCRFGVTGLKPILESTKILFVTEEELALLSRMNDAGKSVRTLMNLGIRIIVIKKGSAGIHVFSEERDVLKAPPMPARIVDRTGAGDVAAAGFVAGLLVGADLETCVDLALAAASKSVQGYGRSAYPDETILREIMKKGRDSSQQCSVL